MLLSYCLHHHASAEGEENAPEREVDIGMLEVDAIILPPLRAYIHRISFRDSANGPCRVVYVVCTGEMFRRWKGCVNARSTKYRFGRTRRLCTALHYVGQTENHADRLRQRKGQKWPLRCDVRSCGGIGIVVRITARLKESRCEAGPPIETRAAEPHYCTLASLVLLVGHREAYWMKLQPD